MGFGVEFRSTNYGDGWFPFVPDNGARKDRFGVLRASVFNRPPTLSGFGPELTVVNARQIPAAHSMITTDFRAHCASNTCSDGPSGRPSGREGARRDPGGLMLGSAGIARP